MAALKELCLSLGDSDGVIAMGDFNDTPDSDTFSIMEGILSNKASVLHSEGKGTIRYEGNWELIDMFMTSGKVDLHSNMEIVQIPFLMVSDSKHAGRKPFRTYSGPRYIGGVSDHCPIILRIY